MKEHFEYHSYSFLVWKFTKDPALPANHAYKKKCTPEGSITQLNLFDREAYRTKAKQELLAELQNLSNYQISSMLFHHLL